MKQLLLFLSITLSSIIYSQNCEYSMNEIDKFNGNQKILTTNKMVFNKGIEGGTVVNFAIGRINDDKVLIASYYSINGHLCIKSGDSFLIKLENDEIIELFYTGEVKCSRGSTENIGRFYYNSMAVSLTEDVIEELKKSRISMIRFKTSDGNLDLEFAPFEKKVKHYNYLPFKLPKELRETDPSTYFIDYLSCID